ncbi:mucin-17-like isoform X3 [Varroa jacobsoni]|uniref:mucin-17-like isoform X3 n=1 Tax=Varroa jacobsoni TaxID=62625 RepID=UPI000BF6FCF4|nr:mucin-17-like isoform X3 [Varroa jacobsoni]
MAQADLTWFSQQKTHFRSPQPMTTNIFLRETRPECVRRLYDGAAAKNDGQEVCEVVWGDEHRRKKKELLEIETRRPTILTPVHQRSRSAPARATATADDPSFTQNQDETDEIEGVTVLADDDVNNDDDEVVHKVIVLPTPEEQLAQLTKEFPPAIIAIDTSEKSFNRMAAMRKSLIHVDFFIRTKNRKNKKVKRSNTVCDSCSQGGTVRRNSCGVNAIGGQLKLSHSSVQTDGNANNPPTSANNIGGGGSNQQQQLKERTKRRSERLSAGSVNVVSTSVAGADSSGSSQDIPTTLKNEKRISFYEKLKQMGRRRETSKERKDENNKDKDLSKDSAKEQQVVSANGDGVSNVVSQEDTQRQLETQESQQQQKAGAKLPISSNSQAINVAVKLRESSSSRPSEQGQSSSGHWSGTSSGASTRASDYDRDVSPPTVQDSTGSSGHDRSGSSVAPIKKSPSESSLEKDSALSDTTQTTDRAPARILSPVRLKAIRSPQRLGQLRKISTCSDDGESSTYSVDTDGYYTSMHTDSGVPHQIPEKLVEEPEPSPGIMVPAGSVVDSGVMLARRASQGSIDTASVNSILSACDAQAILDDDDLHDLKTLTLTRARISKDATAAAVSHLAQSTPMKSKDKPKPPPPPRTSSVLSPLQGTSLINQTPNATLSTNQAMANSTRSALSETDNEGFIMKTAINVYRYPSICVVSGSSETSESSDETRNPLEVSQVSSLSPINSSGKGIQILQSPTTPTALQQQKQQQQQVQQHETLQGELHVFQIKNAFQPVVMHPTRLRSFSIDENANEKQQTQMDSLNNEIAQAGMDRLKQLHQLESEYSSLPPMMHVGQAQILRLDTESSQQQAESAMKTQASSYQRLYRPTSLLARKYADKEWLTDGPMSLPLELVSNEVSLRRRQSPAVISPTRGILSRNSEILSQSSPTDTETKSLSESPVDNSPLGIPLPPPLSYHPSILDEGSVREPSVAQSPAKSLEDTSGSQQVKYSTLSLGRTARVSDLIRSTTSATIPRSFKPAGNEEGANTPNSANSSTIARVLLRSETESPSIYVSATQDAQRYQRTTTTSVEACDTTSGSAVMVRPPSAASERSMGVEGRGTPLNHFSPIASPQLNAPSPLVYPIAVTPVQNHNPVNNPRSRSGIVDLDLNLESCYVPPPQPEMPTPPNRPSRPSSLYDDKVYATFLPGPHTPVATYVPTKQYTPQNNPSSVPSNYAVPFDTQPLSRLHMKGFSPNENCLPLCSSEMPTSVVGSGRSQYFNNATYQAPASLLFERPVYSSPYGYQSAVADSNHSISVTGQTPAEAAVTIGATAATKRDKLVWSNPLANCMPLTRDQNAAPPPGPSIETYARDYHKGSPFLGETQVALQPQPTTTTDLSDTSQQHHSQPRDRRSWSVQSENPPPQQRDARRASLASDRLGPCKPTSLTDFKRLLIQTRSQMNPAGERKSATKLLKIAKPNPNSTFSSTASASMGGGASSISGSVKRGAGIKFNSTGIEPIQEEVENTQNSPAKLSVV